MPTHPENLEKGYWLVITKYYHFEGYHDQERGVLARPTFSGEPMRLAGKALPFLAVETIHGTVDAIDIRDYAVQRVDSDYVDAFAAPPEETEPVQGASGAVPRMICPLCSAKLAERRTGPEKWILACECGLEATTASCR